MSPSRSVRNPVPNRRGSRSYLRISVSSAQGTVSRLRVDTRDNLSLTSAVLLHQLCIFARSPPRHRQYLSQGSTSYLHDETRYRQIRERAVWIGQINQIDKQLGRECASLRGGSGTTTMSLLSRPNLNSVARRVARNGFRGDYLPVSLSSWLEAFFGRLSPEWLEVGRQ